MAMKLRANGTPAPASDMMQVNRALSIFVDPDHHVFLQSLPAGAGSWACIAGNELDKCEQWIQKNATGTGCYFGINPTNEVDRPTRVGDIVKRRWILIDIDRNKTLQPNDPATENEHEDAKELTFEIQTYLSEIGFPAPVQIDSGNGFHLYYRIEMPNDTEHRDLVHGFLKILDSTFSSDKGKVGHECYDARRISRMPGTWSRRGVASKDRPYRQCKFVYTPKEIGIVPTDLIRRVVLDEDKYQAEQAKLNGTHAPTPAERIQASAFEMKAKNAPTGEDRNKAYGKKALDEESQKLATCPVSGRHNQLVKSAFNLWELHFGGCLTAREVIDTLFVAACRCGLDKDKEHGGDEGILKTIKDPSIVEKARLNPRCAPEEPGRNTNPNKPSSAPSTIDPSVKLITFASEVTPRKIQWLWQGRIPLGKLTTFAGSGGLGKTFVLTDIAARVTRGDAWPDGSSGNMPGKVLYISGEDDPEDTLVPRLIAAGGVRNMVAYFKPEILGQFSLERLDILDIALAQMGGDCRLVCIDPPTSFLGEADDHKNSELRKLLTPLSEWATRHKVSVIFITHINKGGAGKVDAVMRIIGSVAWSNAVRAAHMFARDPDDPERRIFIGVKINGAKERKGLAYKLYQIDPNEVDGVARVEWCGDVETTANEAMAGEKKNQTRGESAAEWLVEKFREKLEWESDELLKDAKNHCHSRDAMFEAKRILQIPKAKKVIHPNGTTAWMWWVPPDWPGFADYDNTTVATLATLENNSTQDVDY